MKLFITIILITMQSAFAMSVPVYSNDAESLKGYISQDKFNSFYDSLGSLDLSISHRNQVLQDSELPLVEFYVRSPEITPAIPGYIAVNVEGSEAGNVDGIDLVAYIPANNTLAEADLYTRALRVSQRLYEIATKHPGVTITSICTPIVVALFYKHYFNTAGENQAQTISADVSKCGICLEAISYPNTELLTNCIHAAEFCGACLIAALNEQNTCPLCRAKGNLS